MIGQGQLCRFRMKDHLNRMISWLMLASRLMELLLIRLGKVIS